MFQNRFLNFVRISSVLNNAAEFFKSEIRRRLFVTAVLLVISRVGYYIPLPGFDRRLMPQDYLSFISGSVDELGDFTAELKLSFFQLGISPQILASILMQVLCHVVPSLVKLRKEGLDGHEKIKSYIWWMSLGFAILEALVVSCYSLPYSIYAASYRVKHVMVTAFLLVCGAMTTTWICDTISESGFGSAVSWWPYMFAVLGIFTIVTMWAVVVTEGCRKIKLQYYGFKLASAARNAASSYYNLSLGNSQYSCRHSWFTFLGHVKEILNPETSLGAEPWVYYSIYGLFVFLFNIFDIANLPKEIADYLNKMGARIPNIKPGKATIEYLTKIQASTRFWGGLLLSILATTSTMLDHYLRHINEGFAIGFTSVLIIVGSIIDLRRSYQAYNVMPSLSKALRRVLQDIGLEFDTLKEEYHELGMALAQAEANAYVRRKHMGRMREVKGGIRRLEKLMNSVSALESALQLMISEIPRLESFILVLGASPIRPQHVYELCFSRGKTVLRDASDFTKSRAAEGLSRMAIRALIAKGAGSDSHPVVNSPSTITEFINHKVFKEDGMV
ncbi:hypothetical protein GH714_024773 [Hevea brasiliensis]|uniref:Uncharacterized protein n=1 Tax=Hevea brasiliensis TaxID=3981 RepID=A0A6A6NIZ6_HEVBR|nr:hypothetical protein GH714_024773 [Hevea brasiliensis]